MLRALFERRANGEEKQPSAEEPKESVQTSGPVAAAESEVDDPNHGDAEEGEEEYEDCQDQIVEPEIPEESQQVLD